MPPSTSTMVRRESTRPWDAAIQILAVIAPLGDYEQQAAISLVEILGDYRRVTRFLAAEGLDSQGRKLSFPNRGLAVVTTRESEARKLRHGEVDVRNRVSVGQ